MTVEERLDVLTNQIAQFVDHVAEVRQTNTRITKRLDQMQANMESMQVNMESMQVNIESLQGAIHSLNARFDGVDAELRSLHDKIDSRTESLGAKIDKTAEFLTGKIEYHVRLLREEAAAPAAHPMSPTLTPRVVMCKIVHTTVCRCAA